MFDEFLVISKKLKDRGINTYLQSPTQLVVAVEWPKSPNQGNSFWLSFLDNVWYIGTWTNRIYRMTQSRSLDDLCYDLLNSSPVAVYSIPKEIYQHYALVELSDRDVGDLFESLDKVEGKIADTSISAPRSDRKH